MKALFIGAGSIGKRHIKDFYDVCKAHMDIPQIHVLRRKTGDLGDINSLIEKQITTISDNDYDVIFITNPTHLHYEALKKSKGRTHWYYIEKPIFESMKWDLSCLDINEKNAYIAAPMRHTLIYKKLKEIVSNNDVFSARVICSSYLPEWRRNVDYRTIYSAHKEMGGGVNLDLVHEIDYVFDLFGQPQDVYAVSGKYSDLEITSNDLSVYIFRYNNKLCEIHLDYFGRKSVRTCEVYTHDGAYIADFINEKIVTPNGIIDCHIVDNEEYKNEMEYFYRFITGKEQSINPPQMALNTLSTALKGDEQ